MTRVGIIKPAEVKKPQAETKPKEPEKDVKTNKWNNVSFFSRNFKVDKDIL